MGINNGEIGVSSTRKPLLPNANMRTHYTTFIHNLKDNNDIEKLTDKRDNSVKKSDKVR